MPLPAARSRPAVIAPRPFGLWAAWLLTCIVLFAVTRVEAGVEPQEVVRQASAQVLDALANEGDALTDDPQRLFALVDTVLVQHMDFERMSRWVLGKHWRGASPEQRERFVQEFRGLLVRTYATALAGYSGQHVEFLAQRPGVSPEEVVVRTEIRQAGGPPIPVNFSLYRRDDAVWKAYDVQIDGISLVANYRTSFAAEVRNGGVDGLIQSLAARNRQAASR